jgi:hypothetical protein
MKKFLSFAFPFSAGLLLTVIFSVMSTVSAEQANYTINATTSSMTELSGTDNGNKTSFDMDINLSSLPAGMTIDSAVLQFSTTGVSSTGKVDIVDKYRPLATNQIDQISLASDGSKQTNRILINIVDWYAYPSHNYGISFQAKDFGATGKVTFSNVKLVLIATLKDTVAPVITKQIMSKATAVSYLLSVETDEPTRLIVKYGKTSAYDQPVSVTADPVDPANLVYSLTHEVVISNLQNGITYHYQVIAIDRAGNETKSADATFLSEITATGDNNTLLPDPGLYPPKNLASEITKDNNIFSIYLTWTASINSDITGYVVYRKMEGEQNFTELVRLDANTLNYTDENLDPATQYEYMLKTYKTDKQSSEGSNLKVSIPSLDDTSVKSKSNSNYNVGSIFLTLFVVAALFVLAGYLVVKFAPRLIKKKKTKDPLVNILRDPTLYEDKVTTGV